MTNASMNVRLNAMAYLRVNLSQISVSGPSTEPIRTKKPADLHCHCYSMPEFDLKLESCTFNLFYSNIPTVEKQIHTTLI